MERRIRYKLGECEITLGLEEAGSGTSVVLLPALSSISTRHEMHPLFERLKAHSHTTSVDWLGFGESPRPRKEWTPDMLSGFLHWLLTDLESSPHAVVAAGHAATYALYEAVHYPGTIERLVLIAPTWRGPLPTVMDGPRAWFARVCSLIDTPILGQILYRLNVSRWFVSRMAREHVYSDPRWSSGHRLQAKLAVTLAGGARHSSVRFVTGALDRVASRTAFLDLFRRAKLPVLVIYGDETPPKSRDEMEAIATVPSAHIERLPKGKLAIHEEFPHEVAELISPFLKQEAASRQAD